jgi:hypothetical protein
MTFPDSAWKPGKIEFDDENKEEGFRVCEAARDRTLGPEEVTVK